MHASFMLTRRLTEISSFMISLLPPCFIQIICMWLCGPLDDYYFIISYGVKNDTKVSVRYNQKKLQGLKIIYGSRPSHVIVGLVVLSFVFVFTSDSQFFLNLIKGVRYGGLGRITGGTRVNHTEQFPYVVSISRLDQHICNGEWSHLQRSMDHHSSKLRPRVIDN